MTTTLRRAIFAGLAAAALNAPLALAQGAAAGGDPTELLYELMARADANSDGAVTHAEMQTARGEMFVRLDADADGYLRADELALDGLGAAAGVGGAGGGGRFAGRRGGGDPMARFDSNGDGVVSAAEFRASEPAWFNRADANGDGAVTVSELDALVERFERLRSRWSNAGQ